MDHRATKEADLINECGTSNKTVADVLEFVGGKISCEMEIPKIVWVKHICPGGITTTTRTIITQESYKEVAKWMDLADFLTFKATGKEVRSMCTLTCKWTFASHKMVNEKQEDNEKSVESDVPIFHQMAKGWNAEFLSHIGLVEV
ncbi:hypothetical protein RFI_21672 [Reticulomyxa filosa]|uniref:Uncharacterized protein n=1 Tax=Reticulomyxa filosa TaxID=46433 RepID=X6MPA4_RETFI|nr:hypothetical protein RFI_21672 [Reticulomyxa filosa]|eukprot:ETO15694.1 hypothetical protein RFI_21672 [Reticulomyxa filosa]